MIDLLWSRWWSGPLLVTGLAISDYICTLGAARWYRERARGKLVLEGSYELNPAFERDIDAGRRLSPRFLVAVGALDLAFIALWWLAHQQSGWPGAYEFMLGAYVLLQFQMHVRHIRNLHLFRTGFGTGGVQGTMTYPRPLLLRVSAVEGFGFAGLYAALYILTGSLFVLGGVVGCLALAAQHWRLARLGRGAEPPPPPSPR